MNVQFKNWKPNTFYSRGGTLAVYYLSEDGLPQSIFKAKSSEEVNYFRKNTFTEVSHEVMQKWANKIAKQIRSEVHQMLKNKE